MDGDVILFVNEEILSEYNEVLRRPKFRLSDDTVDSLLDVLREKGIFTDRTGFEESMPDEDDRVFYEVSLTVEESFLVTGNLKHYPLVPKVVTPTEFIRIIE